MLVIKHKTKKSLKSSVYYYTSFYQFVHCFCYEKKVHVESLLSCVVIWFHFELTHKKKFC